MAGRPIGGCEGLGKEGRMETGSLINAQVTLHMPHLPFCRSILGPALPPSRAQEAHTQGLHHQTSSSLHSASGSPLPPPPGHQQVGGERNRHSSPAHCPTLPASAPPPSSDYPPTIPAPSRIPQEPSVLPLSLHP